jgi:hypothetical protein
MRGGQVGFIIRCLRRVHLFLNNVVTEINAFITDEYRRPSDQLAYFMLAFAAERAIQQLAAVVIASSIFAHQNLYPAPSRMARCWYQSYLKGLCGVCPNIFKPYYCD